MINYFRIITLCIILTGLGLFFSDCKKHRKIDVSGTVTDEYTGEPIPNLRVLLHSSISTKSKYDTEDRKYFTYTNSAGKYNINDAFFSKPNFYGYLRVSDENGIYSGGESDAIRVDDAKFIGETKLTRDLVAACYSKLNVTLNINNLYSWYSARISKKFIGTHPMERQDDFGNPIFFSRWDIQSKESSILGYSNGKTILRTEVKSGQDVVLVTKLDTISSVNCGSIINYTITVN